jgi:hypothetical protein
MESGVSFCITSAGGAAKPPAFGVEDSSFVKREDAASAAGDAGSPSCTSPIVGEVAEYGALSTRGRKSNAKSGPLGG